MGQIIKPGQDRPLYQYSLRQNFHRAGELPIEKQTYTTHLSPSSTPRAWLQMALSVAEGMGISNIPVQTVRDNNQLSYIFLFKTLKEQASVFMAISGVITKDKGYPVRIALGSGDADEIMDDHITAMTTFCDLRSISYHLERKDTGGRDVEFLFDRNCDYYAVQLAREEGGDIARHLSYMASQRKTGQPELLLSYASGIATQKTSTHSP